MPIFARRRLHYMLDDLSKHLTAIQSKSLVKRLSDRNTTNALAAEAELSLLWAISRVSKLTVEAPLANSPRLPDAFAPDLFPSAPSVVEIRAVSDDGFSNKDDMDKTANIIASFADTLRRGAGQHLYFEFLERRYWKKGFHRGRCVDPAFALTKRIREELTEWVGNENWPLLPSLHISEGATDVVIAWKERTVSQFRTISRMPAVAYNLEKNPVYKAIKEKSCQMKNCGADIIKCVFLMDVGCSLLRNLKGIWGGLEVSGEKIIAHALQKTGVDIVCVFSPNRTQRMFLQPQTELFWQVTYFDKRSGINKSEYKLLEMVAAQLPRPNYEGYQARELHKQGKFEPKSIDHLPTQWTYGGGKMTVKVSSRLLLQVMSGQMTDVEFRKKAFGDHENPFSRVQQQGLTIQKAHLESGGSDNDDDYLVFDLDYDWGTRSFLKKID